MTVKPENEEKLFNVLADIKQHNPVLYSRIVTAQNQAGVKFVSEQVREKLGKIPAAKPEANGKYRALGRNKDLEDMQKVFQASPEFCQGWAGFPGFSVSNECKEIKDILPYITGLMKAVVSSQTTLNNEGNSDNGPEPENTLVSQTLANDGNTLTTEPTAAVAANTVSDADKAKMVSMIEGMNRINGPSKSIDANQTVDKLVDLYGDKSHDLLLKALMEPTNYSNISGKSEINTSRAAVQDLISVDKEHANEYANKILEIEAPANTAVQGNEALTNASDPQKFGKDLASFAEIAGKSPELFNTLSGIIGAMPENDPTAQYLTMIFTAVSAMKEHNALTELPISQQLSQQDMLNQLHTSNPEMFGSLQTMLGNIPSPSDQYANAGSILTTMNSIAPVSDNSFTQSLTATIANDGAIPATNDGATPAANDGATPAANQQSWNEEQFWGSMALMAPHMYHDFKVLHQSHVKSGDQQYQKALDIMAKIENENPEIAHSVNYLVDRSNEDKAADGKRFWTEAYQHMGEDGLQQWADAYRQETSLSFPSYVRTIEEVIKEKPAPETPLRANEEPARDNEESWLSKAMKLSFATNPLTMPMVVGDSYNKTIKGILNNNDDSWLSKAMKLSFATNPLTMSMVVGDSYSETIKGMLKNTMRTDAANAQAVMNGIEQNGIPTPEQAREQVTQPSATRTEIPRVNYNGFMYTLNRGNSGRS